MVKIFIDRGRLSCSTLNHRIAEWKEMKEPYIFRMVVAVRQSHEHAEELANEQLKKIRNAL